MDNDIITKNIPLPPKELRFMGETDEAFRRIGKASLDLIKRFSFRESLNILDIGSGYGRLAYAIIDHMDYNNSYIGIDILPKHINWCKDVISFEFPNFQFHHLDIRNHRYNPNGNLSAENIHFDLQDDSIDFCCLFSVFTHMPENEIRNYLKEIRRVLKRGATCLATFFLYDDERLEAVQRLDNPLSMKNRLNDYTLYHNPDDKLHAICYHKDYISKMVSETPIELKDCFFGTWAGGKLFYQDVVVIEK